MLIFYSIEKLTFFKAFQNSFLDFIFIFLGYMLLYLTTIQSLILFCAHLMPTKISSTIFAVFISFGILTVGGYSVHPRNLSKYWSWSQYISPEKWLLPILVADEYSTETLANSAGLQLCRNKQVRF